MFIYKYNSLFESERKKQENRKIILFKFKKIDMVVTFPLTLQIYIKSLRKTNYLIKKTLQRAKFKIKLSEAFSFAIWSTIPPMPLKAILDHLK